MGVSVGLLDGVSQSVSRQSGEVGNIAVEDIQLKAAPAIFQHLPNGGGGGARVVDGGPLAVGVVSPVQVHEKIGVVLVGDHVGFDLCWGQLLDIVPLESPDPVVTIRFFLEKGIRDEVRILGVDQLHGREGGQVVVEIATVNKYIKLVSLLNFENNERIGHLHRRIVKLRVGRTSQPQVQGRLINPEDCSSKYQKILF